MIEQKAVDIISLDIPVDNKLRALLYGKFLGDRQMYGLACDFAERVLHLANNDPCAKAMIDARRAWLRGEIDDHELATTWDIAWATWENDWDTVWADDGDAAWIAREAIRASWVIFWSTPIDAAIDAAKSAVRAIARAAAVDAAEASGKKNAAWVAAWETSWETAWKTARAAEQQWQIEQLIGRIETNVD